MKKFLKYLGITTFAFGLLASPLNPFDSTTANASESVAAYSKTITITKYYSGVVAPPSTYYYNSGGWSGTLRLTSWAETDDGIIIAKYSGTVTCSGPCTMSSAVNK